MDNFIVSARKYRPQKFREVLGQDHVTDTLKNALKSNRLGHAFLFCGPRGVGKTSCARILARTVNCENITEDFEACGTCESCENFNSNGSFNIIELDAASNNSVENIRGLIEQVRYQPQKGKYKVFIIDEVHMLSLSAFNAFLKTLEEPPEHAIFILATTEKNKILPTILSRCLVFDFKRISISDIAKQLGKIAEQSSIQCDTGSLRLIAQKADGSMRDALSIFDRVTSLTSDNLVYEEVSRHLNVLDHTFFIRLTEALLLIDLPAILRQLEEIVQHGFDLHELVIGLTEHFRTLLFCQLSGVEDMLDYGEEILEALKDQSKAAKRSFLLNGMSLGNECELNYRNSQNKRLHVELCLLKIAYSSKKVELHSTEIPAAKKKTPALH